MEHIAGARGAALDAVETPHKVEVPVAAAEFTIRDHLQASGLLLGHQVANGLVLNGLKAGVVERTRGMGGTGVLYGLRAQKAADDIGAKRRVQCGRSAHKISPFVLVALPRQSMSVRIAIVKYAFITV